MITDMVAILSLSWILYHLLMIQRYTEVLIYESNGAWLNFEIMIATLFIIGIVSNLAKKLREALK